MAKTHFAHRERRDNSVEQQCVRVSFSLSLFPNPPSVFLSPLPLAGVYFFSPFLSISVCSSNGITNSLFPLLSLSLFISPMEREVWIIIRRPYIKLSEQKNRLPSLPWSRSLQKTYPSTSRRLIQKTLTGGHDNKEPTILLSKYITVSREIRFHALMWFSSIAVVHLLVSLSLEWSPLSKCALLSVELIPQPQPPLLFLIHPRAPRTCESLSTFL